MIRGYAALFLLPLMAACASSPRRAEPAQAPAPAQPTAVFGIDGRHTRGQPRQRRSRRRPLRLRMAGHQHHAGMAMPPITIPKGARYTEADVRFMQGMIAHHAQAIHMSRMAASRGANPRLAALRAEDRPVAGPARSC